MKTLVISRQDIETLLKLPELINEIQSAYRTYSQNKSILPQRGVTKINESSVVINFPGFLPGYSMFTVKVNVKTPTNVAKGLPFLIGTILLVDQATGTLLSILDSGLITAMRTGAAGAIGVQQLANPNTSKVALIGAGVQGEWQLRALHSIGRLTIAYIYDIDKEKAEYLVKKISDDLKITALVAPSIEQAIENCEILITTTQSTKPIITKEMLHPGMHINAFGADQPGKVEIDSDIFRESLTVVDDKKLSLTDGALNVLFKNDKAFFTQELPEIGEIVGKAHAGRRSSQDISIFANVGLAFQDLVACSIIYKNALQYKKGIWIELDQSALIAQHTSEPPPPAPSQGKLLKSQL